MSASGAIGYLESHGIFSHWSRHPGYIWVQLGCEYALVKCSLRQLKHIAKGT